MPIKDLFIRTYKGDLDWLKFALASINKYVTGYRQVIIAIPENQKHLIDSWGLTNEKIVTVPVYKNDYLGQQISKLEAWKYTNADIITFWDSDTIAFEAITPDDYVMAGLPIIWKTNYESIPEVKFWQDRTQKAIKEPVQFEYMRRMPLTYWRSTLIELSFHMDKIHGQPLSEYVLSQPNNEFSEFNLIGIYSDLYDSKKYRIIDTATVTMPDVKCKQYWSWGGVGQHVEEIKKLIENGRL